MGSPLEDHVPSLLQPLIYELIATLRCLAWLTAARQEYPALLILNRHEVGRDLYVDDVAAVRMRAEVVHEQVVCVVHEEMQCVNHLSVVAHQGHLDRLLNHLRNCLLGSLLFLEQLNLHLLLGLFQQKLGFSDHLLRLFQCLFNRTRLLEDADVIAIGKFFLFLLEEFGANVSLLVQLFRFKLHIDEVSIFQKPRKLVQFLLLEHFELLVE